MFSEPVSESGLVEVAARQREDERDDLLFGRINTEAVQAEEEIHGLEGDALVAVHEGVVAGESKAVGGCEGCKIGVGVVKEAVSRPFEGRFKEAPIAESEGSAMGLDLISVDGSDVYWRKPTGLGHLASSRMALRYRLAPSA